MFSHYIATALAHLGRHKLTTTLNVFSLAIGLACFIVAHGFVRGLSQTDRHLPNSERIHVLTQKVVAPGSNMAIPTSVWSVWPAAQYLKVDVPELEAVARLTMATETPVTAGANKTFANISYADPEIFEIFTWQFLVGDPKAALRDARSTVLGESAAIRLFGSPSAALGRRVLMNGSVDLTVAGVMARPRQPTHLGESATGAGKFEMLVSMDVVATSEDGKALTDNWNSPVNYTYLLLPESGAITPALLRERLESFDDKHVPSYEWQSEFGVIPLSEVAIAGLNALVGTDKSGLSAPALLYLLGTVVLLASCFNYANLATAQAATRGREVGMRRVVGAGRMQLAMQYFGEAAFNATLAIPVAILLAAGGSAMLSSVGIEVVAVGGALWPMALLALALVAAVTLVSGAYPAFILCRVPAIQAIRSGRLRSGPGFVTSLLVIVQFAVTSFLLIVIVVMNAQHRTLLQSGTGMTSDPVVVLSNNLNYSRVQFETLRAELMKQPHVRSVSASMVPPWSLAGALMPLSASLNESARRWTVLNNPIQHDYFQTHGLRLIAGRDFDRTRANDAGSFMGLIGGSSWLNGTAVVIDRALAEQNGWTPEQAVGRPLYLWIPSAQGRAAPSVEIVGVVENRPTRVLGLGANSNLYMLTPDVAAVPSIRIAAIDVAAGLGEIDAVWEKLAPDIAVKRRFADEALNTSLEIFIRIGNLIRIVTGLALLVAVLGLVGMSLHVIGRRTHEIGIRKTLGASVVRVLGLLLRDSSRPVLIANLVVWPLAFLAMRMYLSIFTQRVGLTLTPFIVSLVLTISIACLAVIVQATRAARLRPVTVLRYE